MFIYNNVKSFFPFHFRSETVASSHYIGSDASSPDIVPGTDAAIFWRARVTGQIVAPGDVVYNMCIEPLNEEEINIVDGLTIKRHVHGKWGTTGKFYESSPNIYMI